MGNREKERRDRAQEKARAASYEAVLRLANMSAELADRLSRMASQEAREKFDEGPGVFAEWRKEYVRIQGAFFQEGIGGQTGVDTYMTIEAHLSAYQAFAEALQEAERSG